MILAHPVIAALSGSVSNPTFSIPSFLMCATISVELYLKALWRIEGKDIKKWHSLSKIVGGLSAENRLAIKNLYEAEQRPERGKIPSFEACVAAFDNVFVDWRYAFEFKETTTLSVPSLHDLTRSIQDRIEQLRPGWERSRLGK